MTFIEHTLRLKNETMALDVHCIKRPVTTEGAGCSSQKPLTTKILKRSFVYNISKRIFILFLQTNNNDNSLTYVACSYIAQQMLNNKCSMLNSVMGLNFSSNKNQFEDFDNL